MTQDIQQGNAEVDSADFKKWLIGKFIPEDSLLHSDNIEVKWGKHAAGERKDADYRTVFTGRTLGVLVHGKFMMKFPEQNREVLLVNEGDYVVWDQAIPHTWEVLEDCLIITIRWGFAG
jgi:hypothetical protein